MGFHAFIKFASLNFTWLCETKYSQVALYIIVIFYIQILAILKYSKCKLTFM